MKPEAMHAVEIVEAADSTTTPPKGPPDLRIEIACGLLKNSLGKIKKK